MGIVPGKKYRSTFSLSDKGSLIQPDRTPLVQLFYEDRYLSDGIQVEVTPLIQGVFGYSFDAPIEWKHGDRVAIFVSYIYKGKHKALHTVVDSVTWDLNNLDFLGFTKHLPMTITDTLEESILELPDGRKAVVLILDQGARKEMSRQDSPD